MISQSSNIVTHLHLIRLKVVVSLSLQRAICADIFEDGDWSSCSWVLSPEPYIRACVSDTCQPQPGKTDTTLLCSTLSEYSRQCSHAGGTPPTWRTDNFCRKTSHPQPWFKSYVDSSHKNKKYFVLPSQQILL